LANATSRLQQRQQQMQSLANANLIGPALQLFNQIYVRFLFACFCITPFIAPISN
jgi:hypothetical protein